MTKTVAIIGAGQIGLVANFMFLAYGWEPTVYARTPPPKDWPEPLRFRRFIKGQDKLPEADTVFDTIAFDASDVENYDPDKIGRLIAVSSASVYCDVDGRTLDEASQNGFPSFDGPISEEQSTVAPGPSTYSTRKVRMEQRAMERFRERATILRPCAIHGLWTRHPREWWFVKRFLDGRTRVPLLFGGASRFQTTSAAHIGGFAADAAEHSHAGTFNISDADAPSVIEIGKMIASWMECDADFVNAQTTPSSYVARTPWSVPKPFVVSNAKMSSQYSEKVNLYGNEAVDAVEWLRDLDPADWRTAFPQLAAYPWDLFDYAAEDAYLASL